MGVRFLGWFVFIEVFMLFSVHDWVSTETDTWAVWLIGPYGTVMGRFQNCLVRAGVARSCSCSTLHWHFEQVTIHYTNLKIKLNTVPWFGLGPVGHGFPAQTAGVFDWTDGRVKRLEWERMRMRKRSWLITKYKKYSKIQ